jgi:hypothetical protein
MKDLKKNFDYVCRDGSKTDHWGDFANNRPFKLGKKLPRLMQKGGPKRVEGRLITDACNHLGSYGMGGPGFFGIELDKKGRYPKEWLVLTIWGADEWLRVNNKWLACSSELHHPSKCFFETPITHVSDKSVENLFIGRTVGKFIIGSKCFKMTFLSTDKSPYILEFPSDLSVLSPYGNGQPRQWGIGEKMEDGFIISHTMYINI